jgi:hypothetical protein
MAVKKKREVTVLVAHNRYANGWVSSRRKKAIPKNIFTRKIMVFKVGKSINRMLGTGSPGVPSGKKPRGVSAIFGIEMLTQINTLRLSKMATRSRYRAGLVCHKRVTRIVG